MAPYIFIRQEGHNDNYQITTDLSKADAQKLMQKTLNCFGTETVQNPTSRNYPRGENLLIEEVSQTDYNSRNYFTGEEQIEVQYTLKSNRPPNQIKSIIQKGLILIETSNQKWPSDLKGMELRE